MSNNNFYQSKFKGSDIDESITYVREQLPSVIKDINDVTAKLSDEKANKTEIPSLEGLATEEFVSEKMAEFVDSAPEALDTLNELAEALGNDPNFATTVATEIGKKADKTYIDEEVASPKDVLKFTNGLRLESREDGIYLVSPDPEFDEVFLMDSNACVHATEADYAYWAYSVDCDSEGNYIVDTYATKEEVDAKIQTYIDEAILGGAW